jgi:hypothetical protein
MAMPRIVKTTWNTRPRCKVKAPFPKAVVACSSIPFQIYCFHCRPMNYAPAGWQPCHGRRADNGLEQTARPTGAARMKSLFVQASGHIDLIAQSNPTRAAPGAQKLLGVWRDFQAQPLNCCRVRSVDGYLGHARELDATDFSSHPANCAGVAPARARPTPAFIVANARHSPSYGCALRLNRGRPDAPFGHARKTLSI